MNEQDIQRIIKYSDDLKELRDWEVDAPNFDREGIKRREPPGTNSTSEIAEMRRHEWDENLRPHRMEYRKRVKELLDDKPWGSISIILEEFNPQTAQRLDGTRKASLDQVSSDEKLNGAVEMRKGSLHPSDALKDRIQQLVDALLEIVSRVRTTNGQEQAGKNTIASLNVNIQSSTVTMGDIHQTQNLATGNHNSIGRDAQTPAVAVISWLWRKLKAILHRM